MFHKELLRNARRHQATHTFSRCVNVPAFSIRHGDMIEAFLEAIFEILFGATGRLFFRLFGTKPPSELTAILTGMLVWFAVGGGAIAAWRWH